ncbi:MAG: hypothetical protein OEU36_00735 [Gammaproteobacteria bacterium]|nr:hypothetical protein [Gammaproteobacteria bacterium]
MIESLACWKCGEILADVSLPFRRLEVCPECDAELHVCKMCQSYEPRVSGGCVEDNIEEVSDKERANFCDYFKPSAEAYVAPDDSKSRAASVELDALFGTPSPDEVTTSGESTEADETQQKFEDLFATTKKR